MGGQMFSGLHTMWKTFGNYLERSGWTDALTQAGVASFGFSKGISSYQDKICPFAG